MDDRAPSPVGGFFAVTPGGNGNAAYNPPYSPVYPPSHDPAAGLPYPSGGNHQPYNPAAYHPQRQASVAGTYAAPDYRLQRHVSAAGASYDPGLYSNAAPYPSPAPHRPPPVAARPPLQMPAGARYGYPPYPNRLSGPGPYAMSPSQPYSPSFPPVSQSAPPQNGYQPPPPPPPPHPPGSPAFTSTSFSSSHSPPSQSSLSYSSSIRTYDNSARLETHYHSGSESDVSAPTEPEAPHRPLPSPPKPSRDPRYDDEYAPPPLPSLPAHPAHNGLPPQRAASRPLPQVPNGSQRPDQSAALFDDIESSLNDMGSGGLHDDSDSVERFRANGAVASSGGPSHPSQQAGHRYDSYSNESDAEAAGGLEMMRQDEQFAAERDRRDSQAYSLPLASPPPPPPPPAAPPSHPLPHPLRRPSHAPHSNDQDDDDADYDLHGVDIGMIEGGGFGGYFGAFGGQDGSPSNVTADLGRADSGASSAPAPAPSTTQQQPLGQFYIPAEADVHPFPEFESTARVDNWGTGGLVSSSKQQKRLSFDDGDENIFDHPAGPDDYDDDDDDSFPELFYHPPSSAGSPLNTRPLPSPPAYSDYIPELRPAGSGPPYEGHGQGHGHGHGHGHALPAHPRHAHVQSQYGAQQQQQPHYPAARTTYSVPGTPQMYSAMSVGGNQPPYNSNNNNIPRTASLASHPSGPTTVPPVRSKTDGRAHPKSNRASMVNLPTSELLLSPGGLAPSDLPAIPLARKFDPKKLSTRDFRRCSAPWALSGISAWLKEITEGEQDLKEALVADAVAALFTHYVPTMNVADAETLAAKIVAGMLKEKNLVKDEEWVKFGPGDVSGVIYQATGTGCYAPRLHELDGPGRCYAHHCARTLRKISLPPGAGPIEPKQAKEDWATFWKVKKDDLSGVGKKEVERQNNLHEIVQTEEEFMEHLTVLKVVYRDQIVHANPPIIKPGRLDNFVRDVFGKADAVRLVSEEHLLPQLKFRQREQGPWVVGFSDIFREWIRKAKTAYLEYASAFPRADMLVRREVDRNMIFKQFLDNCRQDPRARRLDWVTFLKAPITRLQRYSLLLATVLKHTTTETEEKRNLELAIDEIKGVTLECDSRVDEMKKRVQLYELGQKLMMRQWPVDLRLEEKGRELIFRGDLQRTGNRFAWLETHCILFDHYLVLAKTMMQKEQSGGTKHERYDVSRMPVPMDLLVLESTNDDPVVRGAANRLGIAGPATTANNKGGRHSNSSSTVPTLQHTNTSTSIATTATAPGRLVTALPDQSAKDDKILYPFRIKHLGNPARVKTDDNTYILYAPTAANRQEWCNKIILAKERHAASLYAQNAEPFRINVMADAAFGYETTQPSTNPIRVRGTPLDRAIAEVEKRFDNAPKPAVICKAQVNCATAFTAHFSREMVAIGTDYGVFVAEANNPRGWKRAVTATKVTQIAVLEEFSSFLVLADKALVAYHLDAIVPPPGPTANSTSKQRPPQKLSRAKDVGFFATGRIKDRTLVFYKKREGLSSTFKVLEPVFQKPTDDRRSRLPFGRKGTTEFFREYDDFYIPTDCYGINIFTSSLAVHTSKGFEVMTLDKKQAWSVPELRAGSHVDDIASRLSGEKPLGMFRLSDIDLLCCYEECAVYVNKHGDISRSVVMEFVGKGVTVAMYGPYVLVFDPDFVEIRNAQNGRLRQVISGRDVRCLDIGTDGPKGRTVKVAMAHPEAEGRQLVIELVLNEGQRD